MGKMYRNFEIVNLVGVIGELIEMKTEMIKNRNYKGVNKVSEVLNESYIKLDGLTNIENSYLGIVKYEKILKYMEDMEHSATQIKKIIGESNDYENVNKIVENIHKQMDVVNTELDKIYNFKKK